MSRTRATRAGVRVGFSGAIFRVAAALVCVCAVGVSAAAGGTTYYVNPGDSIQAALNSVSAGDTVIIRDGTHNLPGELDTVAAGTAAQRITVKAENPRGALLTRSGGTFRIDLPYYTVEGLIFDAQYANARAIRVRSDGDYLHFLNNEVRRAGNNGIDMGDQTDVLIEGSLIHHTIMHKSTPGDPDAHGIVTGGVQNLTVRNTEIYYVSGDSLQVQNGGWDNVLVENCTFWNGPLAEAVQGWSAGENPGENAIDTKEPPEDIRGAITIRNSTFYGWKDSRIGAGAAALRLKQHCDVIVEGNTLYGNHMGIRSGGYADRAPGDVGVHTYTRNNVFYDNDIAIDYRDDVAVNVVLNNTFGDGNDEFFTTSGAHQTGDILNNLFWAPKPSPEGDDASNLAAVAADFVKAAGNDYHLVMTSAAIDAGLDLLAQGVTVDRDGNARYYGAGFDVGAYEIPEPATLALLAAGSLTLLRRRRRR